MQLLSWTATSADVGQVDVRAHGFEGHLPARLAVDGNRQLRPAALEAVSDHVQVAARSAAPSREGFALTDGHAKPEGFEVHDGNNIPLDIGLQYPVVYAAARALAWIIEGFGKPRS